MEWSFALSRLYEWRRKAEFNCDRVTVSHFKRVRHCLVQLAAQLVFTTGQRNDRPRFENLLKLTRQDNFERSCKIGKCTNTSQCPDTLEFVTVRTINLCITPIISIVRNSLIFLGWPGR